MDVNLPKEYESVYNGKNKTFIVNGKYECFLINSPTKWAKMNVFDGYQSNIDVQAIEINTKRKMIGLISMTYHHDINQYCGILFLKENEKQKWINSYNIVELKEIN